VQAMVLEAVGCPLRLVEREMPRPGPGQVLVEIAACAVCRIDLRSCSTYRGPDRAV
jgi:propanol-preferring alcohol dehydrogenase